MFHKEIERRLDKIEREMLYSKEGHRILDAFQSKYGISCKTQSHGFPNEDGKEEDFEYDWGGMLIEKINRLNNKIDKYNRAAEKIKKEVVIVRCGHCKKIISKGKKSKKNVTHSKDAISVSEI